MKRGKKLILMLVALAIVCTAALAATKLAPKEGPDEEENSAVSIFSLSEDAVTKLAWTYNGGSQTFEAAGDGWTYTEDPAFPTKDSVLDAMVLALGQVDAYKTIEAPEDLAQYGLEEPVCTITVTAGSETTLCLGNETGIGGQRYLSLGDGNVYLVDSGILDSFAYNLYDVVQYETIPDMTQLSAVSVDAEAQQLSLAYLEDSGLAYSDSYVWFLQTSGGYTPLDTDLTEDFVEKVTQVSWQSCVNYDAANLSEYGLDTPSATVSVTYMSDADQKQVFTLLLGDTVDDSCYAMIQGSDMVYLVSNDILNAMLYTAQEELLPNDILLMDWDTVTSMDITLDGQTYTAVKTTEEASDQEDAATETVWKVNDTQVTLEDVLDSLTSLSASGSGAGLSPSRDAEISFLFHRNTDSFQEVELTFYPYDSNSCLVSLNGETRLFVSRTDVASIVETVKALLPG